MAGNDVLSAITLMKDVDYTAQIARAQRESARSEERTAIASYMTELNHAIRDAKVEDPLLIGLHKGVVRHGRNFDFDVGDGSRNIHGIPILPYPAEAETTLILNSVYPGFVVRYRDGGKHILIRDPRSIEDWEKSGVMGLDTDGELFTRDSLERFIAGHLRTLEAGW